MKCDICGINESVLFVKQAGEIAELYLCLDCAKKRGLSSDSSKLEFSLTGLLSDLLHAKNRQLFSEDVLCPSCGISLQTLIKTRRAGCAECYTAFKKHIALYDERYPQTYVGSLPKRLSHFRSILTDRMHYQSKLEQAVQNEDYEKAAVYRDLLKTLDSTPVQGVARENAHE